MHPVTLTECMHDASPAFPVVHPNIMVVSSGHFSLMICHSCTLTAHHT